MKTIVNRLLIGLLSIFTSCLISIIGTIIFLATNMYVLEALIVFVLYVISIAFFLNKYKTKFHVWGVIGLFLVGIGIVKIWLAPSFIYVYKTLPSITCYVLGILAGYFYHSFTDKRRYILPGALMLFPLILSINLYALWVHKVEYGNFYGKVEDKETISFELTNDQGDIVDKQTLTGKVVLFDFWYIGCRPCYTKFPDLQRIYEQYESDDRVAIYAVNRPMPHDEPNASFTDLSDRDFTFPVLQGTQELMDRLCVYVYPTVVILNSEREKWCLWGNWRMPKANWLLSLKHLN